MPFGDAQSMMTLCMMLLAGGIWLRLVAKEKHRREKYLHKRLEDKIEELKNEAMLAEQKKTDEENPEEAEPVATVNPV